MRAPVIHKDELERMYKEYFIQIVSQTRRRDVTVLSFEQFVSEFAEHSGFEICLPREDKGSFTTLVDMYHSEQESGSCSGD